MAPSRLDALPIGAQHPRVRELLAVRKDSVPGRILVEGNWEHSQLLTTQTAVDTWTRAVQDAFGKLSTGSTQADPSQVIDQVFDFATKLLAVQRDFAKNLVKSSSVAGEAVSKDTSPTA